jgi:carbamoyltransferase
MYAWHEKLGMPRRTVAANDSQRGSYLGPEYNDAEVQRRLDDLGAAYTKMPAGEVSARVANVIANGNVVGWFNGRMEFGPRALGSRSILGDPRSPKMQSVMNLKIKFRESFRPFAPSVLAEKAKEWFDMDGVEQRPDFSSPYMLIVGRVRKEKLGALEPRQAEAQGIDKLKFVNSAIPAVTHVDNSARIQTVRQEDSPAFYGVIQSFEEITGGPVLINTSFYVRGEPIVESPEDAYRCFMRTGMDYLVIGSYLLKKDEQPEFVETTDWQQEFQLD